MTESAWLNMTRLNPLAVFGLNAQHASLRQRTLFACACCRCAQDWALPDLEGDAIDATERYADGDISRRTWLKRSHALQSKDAAWSGSATEWERDFRAAVTALFFAAAEWDVSDRLISATGRVSSPEYQEAFEAKLCSALRDIIGNPFRTVTFAPEWRTSTVSAIAVQMYRSRDFSAMPILADALQDAGCDNDEVLRHCREQKEHVRGCWVVDQVLGKA